MLIVQIGNLSFLDDSDSASTKTPFGISRAVPAFRAKGLSHTRSLWLSSMKTKSLGSESLFLVLLQVIDICPEAWRRLG